MVKATLILVLCTFVAYGQKKLTLQKNQIVMIKRNVNEFTLDSLVMNDSSTLIFGGRKTMYLTVNHLVAGKGCLLEGSGRGGKKGDQFPNTNDNVRRTNLTRPDSGWPGWEGTNLFITIKDIVLQDSLTISTRGGNGGDGAQVAAINAMGTRPGVSPNPYNGLPGMGGVGGKGGNVMIAYSPSIEDEVRRIAVLSRGGKAGQMPEFIPVNQVPLPFSVNEQLAQANVPWYLRKTGRDGMPGKVKLMKLKE